MMAAIRDWRAWIWPFVAAGVVLAITAAGVLTVPEKVETRAQKHPPHYVKLAARAAARRYGAKQPAAVEWIVTSPAQLRTAKFRDDRPVYKKDCLILVQADFTASPGTPPKPPGQQRSSWVALLYTAGKSHQQLAVLGAYATRPVTKPLPSLKRYEW
jgi:hypothetical protein